MSEATPASTGAEPTGVPSSGLPAAPQASSGPQPLWRRPLVRLAAGAVLLLLVACVLVLTLTGGGTKDLKVSFSLDDFMGRSTCAGGAGGYGDIGPGTDVVVKDNANNIIGKAQLGDGPSVPMSKAVNQSGVGGCIWSTTVKGVPTGKDFYQVSVGRRGTSTYTSKDLDASKWSIDLKLGGS